MKKFFLFLTLLTLGVGQMWGTTVNFSVGTYATAQSWTNATAYSSATIDSYITATKNGTGDNGKYYTSNSSWRFYEANSGGITISTSSGTISSITFTYANGNNGVIKYNNTEKTSGTAISVSGSSVSFTVGHSSGTKNGNVQITAISVTYTPAASSYTLSSAVSPAASGSVNLSSTSLTQGSTATATATPAQHYVFSSWSISGTGASLSSTSTNPTTVTMGTANATVTATFAQAPKASITLYEAGTPTTDETTYYVGDEYTLPTSTEATCNGKVLVGWSTIEVPETNTKPTSNYHEKGAKVTLAASQTFYAVFATASTGAAPTAYTAGDEGTFVLAANVSGTWYALPANPTVSSGKIAGEEITVSTSATSVNYVTSTNASGYEWTIADATNGQTISDGTSYIYHSNGGASGTNLTYGNGTTYTWNIASETGGLTFQAMNGSTTNSRGMLVSGTQFGGYALSNEGGSGYSRIQVLPISDGTTYTAYSTDCCQPLASINGSFFWPTPFSYLTC